MPTEDCDGYEYKYTWTSETTVSVGHFLVTGGFRQGTGSRGMREMLDRFRAEGAERVQLTMGGGEDTEEFLHTFAQDYDAATLTVRSINPDGHVTAAIRFTS